MGEFSERVSERFIARIHRIHVHASSRLVIERGKNNIGRDGRNWKAGKNSCERSEKKATFLYSTSRVKEKPYHAFLLSFYQITAATATWMVLITSALGLDDLRFHSLVIRSIRSIPSIGEDDSSPPIQFLHHDFPNPRPRCPPTLF